MFGPHFNKNFLLVALFVILFISIINPFSRVTIFRVEAYHIEASTTSWSCILHVAFLVILASIIDTPPSRQTFIGECNQCKTAVFTFWSFALQVTFWMVCLKKNKNINKIRIILIFCCSNYLSPSSSRAATGSRSSYDVWPKFDHVQWNPTCPRTWWATDQIPNSRRTVKLGFWRSVKPKWQVKINN